MPSSLNDFFRLYPHIANDATMRKRIEQFVENLNVTDSVRNIRLSNDTQVVMEIFQTTPMGNNTFDVYFHQEHNSLFEHFHDDLSSFVNHLFDVQIVIANSNSDVLRNSRMKQALELCCSHEEKLTPHEFRTISRTMYKFDTLMNPGILELMLRKCCKHLSSALELTRQLVGPTFHMEFRSRTNHFFFHHCRELGLAGWVHEKGGMTVVEQLQTDQNLWTMHVYFTKQNLRLRDDSVIHDMNHFLQCEKELAENVQTAIADAQLAEIKRCDHLWMFHHRHVAEMKRTWLIRNQGSLFETICEELQIPLSVAQDLSELVAWTEQQIRDCLTSVSETQITYEKDGWTFSKVFVTNNKTLQGDVDVVLVMTKKSLQTNNGDLVLTIPIGTF